MNYVMLINQRGLEYAPDFITIDGGEEGSGAAPQVLFDHASLPITEALPRVMDSSITVRLEGPRMRKLQQAS